MKNKSQLSKTDSKTHRIRMNTNPEVPDYELKQVLRLITQQSKQYCYEIKHLLYQKMNFNISHKTITEDIKNPSLAQLKSVTVNLNKDLKKIYSLLKIYMSQKNQTNYTSENNNDNLALKMGLIIAELAGQIKKIKLNYDLKPLTANMHFLNLISLLKTLSSNIFGYSAQKQEYQELLNQIKSKSPLFEDHHYNKTQKPYEIESKKQKEVHNRAKQEIQSLKIQNCKIKEMFEQQIQVLRQFNKKLKDELEGKLSYIQKNEQDYIAYIKKYNILIDKLKTTNLNNQQVINQMEEEVIKIKQENLKLKKQNRQLQKEYEQSKLIKSAKKYSHYPRRFEDAYEDFTTATKKSLILISHKNNKSK